MSIIPEPGPTIQDLHSPAEAVLRRAGVEWLDGASKDADFMMRQWNDRIRTADPYHLHDMVRRIAGNMDVVAGKIGFAGISSAALDLLTSMFHLELNFDHEDARMLAIREEAIGSHMSLLHARILAATEGTAEMSGRIAA